jgi:hypothetical protein
MPNSDDEEFAADAAANPVQKAARSIIMGGYDLTMVTDMVRNGDIEGLSARLSDQVPDFWGPGLVARCRSRLVDVFLTGCQAVVRNSSTLVHPFFIQPCFGSVQCIQVKMRC